ncbi:phosphotransferase [Actinophytocola oryzae]|uniref:Phosphotransferase family enzyme n=1 Tax=Actinophytocola oryzae TaxID=502181 RepID=A0A4R7VHV5_9PSEU|nr:phosphotransferase [Actinophytocola oryzae]TDV48943.1 phosphotransferase family enzyme [Actinophytocola oryzae]
MEHVLTGGNVAAAVVRVGDTVRKPVTPATPAVEALLNHLDGFPGAPRHLGRDDQGRQVLEYIPGTVGDLPETNHELHRVGRLIRDLHDALQDFSPPPDARWHVVIPPDREDLVCHHDLAPWNLVRAHNRWVFIDWDGAGPGSRLWDLAYAAQSFVSMTRTSDPHTDAPRLRALADGYGLDDHQRAELPEHIGAHTRGMYDLLRTSKEEPWTRLYAEGHADHWGPAADYVERHLDVWRTALR